MFSTRTPPRQNTLYLTKDLLSSPLPNWQIPFWKTSPSKNPERQKTEISRTRYRRCWLLLPRKRAMFAHRRFTVQRILYRRYRTHVAPTSNVVSRLTTTQLSNYKEYYNNLRHILDDLPQEVTDKSVALTTLHKRLQLPQQLTTSHLARCLTCRSSNSPMFLSSMEKGKNKTKNYSSKKRDNYGLNILGKNLLSFQTTKELMLKYPRLPLPVLNVAINAYINDTVLSEIVKSWGVEIEETSFLQRFLSNEPFENTLGRLRFLEYDIPSTKNNDGNTEFFIRNRTIRAVNFDETNARALFFRSLIAVLWTIDQNLSKSFIQDHILKSRKLDIVKLFQFDKPLLELNRLSQRENFEPVEIKLLAESGRLSATPVFIMGVYNGSEKIGEGFGSSLQQARNKAAMDALLKWYCYEPLKPMIDTGDVVV